MSNTPNKQVTIIDHTTVDYNQNVKATMSVKEYYDFRNLAAKYGQKFDINWIIGQAIVTCEAPFLIRFGYDDCIEF